MSTLSPFDREITFLQDLYTLDQILEISDLTDYEVLHILLSEGHMVLPEYIMAKIDTSRWENEEEGA